MNDLTDERNRDSVQRIRLKFLIEAESNPDLYHRIDISRVQSEDWQIERFVLDNHCEDEAFKALVKAMQWKNSFGIHDRTDEYFPKELFHIFGGENPSRDKEGRLAYWAVHKYYKKIPDLSQLFHQFLSHQIERIDRKSGNKGWLSINDCSGVHLSNVDMTIAKFRIELLNYYPKGMKYGINVDLPWFIGPIYKIIKNFMRHNIRDHIILLKRDELKEYFDEESIPISFGGQRVFTNELSSGLLPLYQLKHLNFSEKQIEIFYDTYKIDRSVEN